MPKEYKEIPKSQVRWMADHTKVFSIRLMRKTDQDVIDYLEPRNKRNTILAAIREYIRNHPES